MEIQAYIWVIWIFTSLSLARLYFYVARHMREFIAKPAQTRFNTPKLIFQITTKGKIPIVQQTINQIHNVCQKIGYNRYEIWVVTDAQEEFQKCRTIVVPPTYSCNAAFKGRALQYAVELRQGEAVDNKDLFIYHFDDESLMTQQTICSVLTFLEHNPSPISEGLITYPLGKNEKIKVTNLLDTLRPFCCFECVDFMKKGNPVYIHGSNLLVRADFEQQVGWDSGKTMAEDSLFAVAAKNKFGSKSFGWHGGVIEEKSPSNLRDFVKQRKRWFSGMVQNLKFLSTKDRLVNILRALLWSSGLLSGLASILVLIVPQQIPYFLKIAFLFGTALWLLSYQMGAFLNGKYLVFSKRIKFHFLTLIAAPILGLIECSIPVLYLINRPTTFEVIKKS